MIQGYTKYVDNLKLRKFTGNTSVYNTNYSNMSITANALDGWAPDNWATTSATVDQAAGQYRLVAIGTGATAKVQREFTAMPNQEHRFQYNLSLLNAGSTTVRVEQKVNGVYQYLATQQTQTTSGTYELSFVPSFADIRISVSGTSRYALNNLYLDRDQIDTLISTYALSRGYRYGYGGHEKNDEVSGSGKNVDMGDRWLDTRLGRTFKIDLHSSSYPFVSPYSYGLNNPNYYVDLDGKDVIPMPSFNESRYGAVYQQLIEGSETYNKIIEPYKSQRKLNLILDIDHAKATSRGYFATTTPPHRAWKIYTDGPNKGKMIPNSLVFTSHTTEYYSNEMLEWQTIDGGDGALTKSTFSDLFLASTIIHESLHALVVFNERNILNDFEDPNHSKMNDFRELLILALSEYVAKNELQYSMQDIEDIAWNGTEQSLQFNNHFENLANKNGTSKSLEIKNWTERLAKLAYTSDEKDSKTVEE